MAKLPFLRLTIFALPVLVLSGCFWSTSAPSDSSELLPSSPDESTNTLSGGVESGSTAKPIGAVRAASGTIVTFADDKTITLTRTGVISLDSGYKIVGNGEVVWDDGNQIGYMAVGDTLDIDENGAVEWHRIASGSTTGSGSSGSVDTGATATGLTATGSIPMLDPESRAIGPTSDDSTR